MAIRSRAGCHYYCYNLEGLMSCDISSSHVQLKTMEIAHCISWPHKGVYIWMRNVTQAIGQIDAPFLRFSFFYVHFQIILWSPTSYSDWQWLHLTFSYHMTYPARVFSFCLGSVWAKMRPDQWPPLWSRTTRPSWTKFAVMSSMWSKESGASQLFSHAFPRCGQTMSHKDCLKLLDS